MYHYEKTKAHFVPVQVACEWQSQNGTLGSLDFSRFPISNLLSYLFCPKHWGSFLHTSQLFSCVLFQILELVKGSGN